MNIEEWGTPVSRDKIIYRRNRLIEYQRVGELRFTPLYEAIDENILDINYMIYEIDKLQSNWNSLRECIDYQLKHNVGSSVESSIRNHVYQEIKDKMNELEGKDKI